MTAILDIDGIGKSFGAFRALADIGFSVREGETFGLIGPNGAGKTTLFNIITGFLRAGTGTIRFAGQDIARMAPAARVAQGLVRTFQTSMVFPALSLRENLAMAARRHAGDGLRWRGARRVHQAATAAVDQLLAESGLAHRAEAPIRDLSHGEQRMADVLMALALRPRLLLLDEPTAGLTAAEAERLLAMLRRPGSPLAVMLVAHDIDIVFSRCDRVAVLDLGRLLRVGAPDVLRADDRVRAAYLGTLAAP